MTAAVRSIKLNDIFKVQGLLNVKYSSTIMLLSSHAVVYKILRDCEINHYKRFWNKASKEKSYNGIRIIGCLLKIVPPPLPPPEIIK